MFIRIPKFGQKKVQKKNSELILRDYSLIWRELAGWGRISLTRFSLEFFLQDM